MEHDEGYAVGGMYGGDGCGCSGGVEGGSVLSDMINKEGALNRFFLPGLMAACLVVLLICSILVLTNTGDMTALAKALAWVSLILIGVEGWYTVRDGWDYHNRDKGVSEAPNTSEEQPPTLLRQKAVDSTAQP
jgi:hypothetical protein